MKWTVKFTRKAAKQVSKLPPRIVERLDALRFQIAESGPIQPSMPHFGKLQGFSNVFHCHLNKGRPVYVAVWAIEDQIIKLVEVTYVGTHEKAPY